MPLRATLMNRGSRRAAINHAPAGEHFWTTAEFSFTQDPRAKRTSLLLFSSFPFRFFLSYPPSVKVINNILDHNSF